ncbi:2-hydroxy-3-oxopropionate reductase [Arthrobacter sp. SLBN-100]|uniref:NAD(P)-dependent oxidoreductase n=1 Tax=Arthrobacter sp. SLBN-100 TaxID=2768450 RepID=UPI001153124C|nr:NAD(P)-dependent oxidoreductase [Arthrobacter sp. SLBN-100]TQJ66940.1 2-hydroxy-3-oxopropionate reductase [Arthrobacter sp. SLBN-100]
MQDRRAGFVGLGLMGLPMAANAVNKGWQVTGWNRSPGPVLELQKLGGARAEQIADMRDLPAIIFMLPDLAHIEEAAAGLLSSWEAKPPAPGTIVLVMSSVSPTGVKEFGRRIAALSLGNAQVVDAPVSGGTQGAMDGTLAIMAGGDGDAFLRAGPLLRSMGTTVRHLGPLGAGSLAKACNQLVVGTTTAALAEAAELAERSGLDPAELFKVLRGGLAGSRVLDIVGPRLASKDYTATGPAKFMHKDLSFVLEAARVSGTAVPMAEAGVELYAELKRQGLGDQDLAVVRQAIFQLSHTAAQAAEGTVHP